METWCNTLMNEIISKCDKLSNRCESFCGSPDSYFLYKNVTATKESFCRICSIHHVIISQQVSSALHFRLWLHRQQLERELYSISCNRVLPFVELWFAFVCSILWCYLKMCVFVCTVFLLSGCCEEDISHECVILTMLLEVVLGIVFSSMVAAETAANNKLVPLLSYNGISLPLQHVPYFLNNNKELAKQCNSDPFCPFKVRRPLNTPNLQTNC